MGKKKTGKEARSPRPVNVKAQRSPSWVKHGHKKLYLFSGIVLAAIILGAWLLSSGSTTPSAEPRVGQAAPDFTFTTMNGTTSSLSIYRGHPLVLWWITSWCTSCQDGTKVFAQNYYSQYRSAGVVLLQVESYNNLGQAGPDLNTFASSYGYSGQSGWVLSQGPQGATTTYNPSGYLDYYYVISSQGIILGKNPDLPGSFGSALQQASGH